jgi:probable rRNA maturation factor
MSSSTPTPAAGIRRNCSIEIANRQTRRIPRRWIRRAVVEVLEETRWRTVDISVAVVDDRSMRQLNRRFLGHDFATDVLSFPLAKIPRRGILEGEIVVSADTAARQARRWGVPFRNELLLYVVHGMLHLVGYRDHTEGGRRRMRRGERAIFQRLQLAVPPGNESLKRSPRP